jgi:GNAT superfamily N-acetyltransferase
MTSIRPCRQDELPTICAIVNAAAEAYRGIIPDDCFHEPYMPLTELQGEVAAGVKFWASDEDGALVGVMGIQPQSPLHGVPGTLREPVRDVDLIRHSYVLPSRQRRGIGGALLEHLQHLSTRRMLVGTWAAATWAIDFYRRHGFAEVSSEKKNELLRRYWTIPDRQIETSVVLANPPLDDKRP